jgi:large subunit ribosomal protein L30
MIAIIRVRGEVKTKGDIEDTMLMLNLKTVNNCVVIPETETYIGMLHKIKDHVTYGTITKEVFKKMLVKWGRSGQKRLQLKEADKIVDEIFTGKKKLKEYNINPTFRLHPPKRGYEGIKRSYTEKGTLGNRGDKINALLERMI